MFTAFCTFLLLIAGGLVTSTGSGLSVPDWPTTYGQFMFAFPLNQMTGGIVYEHTHRMIASVVGFLTLILAIWLWKREERRWVRLLGIAALGTVIAQGLLGGLTVLFLLPPAISAGHATLAQTFFTIMISLVCVTSEWWRTDSRSTGPVGVVWLPVVTAAAIYLQLILGAVMRHTNAGLAVPDFPLAYGQVWPSLSPEFLEKYNSQLIQSGIRIAADGAVTASQVSIHMLHRLWAAVVSVLVVWTSVRILRVPNLARWGYVLLILLASQIALGALTVVTAKNVLFTTAHVAVGALLLVTSAALSLRVLRLSGLRPTRIALGEAAV